METKGKFLLEINNSTIEELRNILTDFAIETVTNPKNNEGVQQAYLYVLDKLNKKEKINLDEVPTFLSDLNSANDIFPEKIRFNARYYLYKFFIETGDYDPDYKLSEKFREESEPYLKFYSKFKNEVQSGDFSKEFVSEFKKLLAYYIKKSNELTIKKNSTYGPNSYLKALEEGSNVNFYEDSDMYSTTVAILQTMRVSPENIDVLYSLMQNS